MMPFYPTFRLMLRYYIPDFTNERITTFENLAPLGQDVDCQIHLLKEYTPGSRSDILRRFLGGMEELVKLVGTLHTDLENITRLSLLSTEAMQPQKDNIDDILARLDDFLERAKYQQLVKLKKKTKKNGARRRLKAIKGATQIKNLTDLSALLIEAKEILMAIRTSLKQTNQLLQNLNLNGELKVIQKPIEKIKALNELLILIEALELITLQKKIQVEEGKLIENYPREIRMVQRLWAARRLLAIQQSKYFQFHLSFTKIRIYFRVWRRYQQAKFSTFFPLTLSRFNHSPITSRIQSILVTVFVLGLFIYSAFFSQ